jgi:DNA gyrase subunit A
VISLIRSSKAPDEAKQGLISRFDFSPVQAQAILDMRLQRLTGLEREKITNEYREILALIERLEAILASEQLVLDIIRKELSEIRESYSDPRRTEIIAAASEYSIEDLIADEEMVITVSRGGYIKRSPLHLYRAQRRGGKGKIGMTTKEEDIVEHLFVASTHAYILVFTDRGRLYWLKVHALPQIGAAARGKAIVNLLNVEPGENVRALLSVRNFQDAKYVVMVTRKGRIKKTALSAFSNVRVAGIIAVDINEGDDLLSVELSDGESQIFIGTYSGKAIRFEESQVRPMGRGAAGVKAISLRKDDHVVGMAVISKEHEDCEILTVTERGFAKRTDVDAYRLQSRGGLGVTNIRTTEKNGKVAAVKVVSEEDQLLLITSNGKMIRTSCSHIRSVGRSTQGVRVINLDGGDQVVAAVKIVEKDDGDAEGEDQEMLISEDAPESADQEEEIN